MNEFPINKYVEMNLDEKINYLSSHIHFGARMQGGFEYSYISHVIPYISKWYVDTFSKFDSTYLITLNMLVREFKVDTECVEEMIQFDYSSTEWFQLAKKYNLIKNNLNK